MRHAPFFRSAASPFFLRLSGTFVLSMLPFPLFLSSAFFSYLLVPVFCRMVRNRMR